MRELVTVYTENQTIMLLRGPRQSCPAAPTRAPRRAESCPSQVLMNAKYSYQRLESFLAANIRPGDLVGVLTYDNEHLPRDRSKVQQDFKIFCLKLRKAYGGRGQAPRYIWNYEQSHADGVHKGRRWHIHFALRAMGDDYALIQRCWPHGVALLTKFSVDPKEWTRDLGIKSKIISTSDRGYEPLARYMCKEAPEKVGQHTWSRSRSCLKPEVDKVIVDDDFALHLPQGCTLVTKVADSNSYELIKYINQLAPGQQPPPAKR